MASSSSSSSSSSSLEYQVFLSFRGIDTRKTFTGHLYHALNDKGVRTFIDNEELHTGRDIEPALITAIEKSRISIPVFSRNYASSKWTLQELAKIFQCYKTNDQIVLPIFYDVEPREIRNQTGTFGEAFRKHEKPEPVDEWSEALKEVGKLKGWELKEIDSGDESKLIQLVVKRVLSELNSISLEVAKYPIGLDFHVERLLALFDECTDPQFVGICGMSGIGKTTIAKAIYNQIFKNFDGSSFLADIREEASNHKGLVSLQNQLLNNILREQEVIHHVDRGKKLIEERLKGKKVLLILDDVDTYNQLEGLAGKLSWFGCGSKIIITTLYEQVLRAAGVEDKNIYKPVGLDYDQSLQLFNMHSFGSVEPPDDYVILSMMVTYYAKGLPSTLEKLGSSLHIQGIKGVEWKSEWPKIIRFWRSKILSDDKKLSSLDTLLRDHKLKLVKFFKKIGIAKYESIFQPDKVYAFYVIGRWRKLAESLTYERL